MLYSTTAWIRAEKIKNIASFKGDRDNVLIGYGLVIGLKGTGDSALEVTQKSLLGMLNKMGLNLKDTTGIKSKNTASVVVTAKLPAFARTGAKIDCSVNSIGDATQLDGGQLVVTPLRGGNNEAYAMCHGPLSSGGNIIRGATVEKELDIHFAEKKALRLNLNEADFTTAARMVTTINGELGGKFAEAKDGATIDIIVPSNYEGNTVGLAALLENFEVFPDIKARVVLNEKTGTVVMGSTVQILPVAIAHGDLSIQVGGEGGSSQTNKKSKTHTQKIFDLTSGTTVADLIKSLNILGVGSKDLMAIFQTIKQAGALHAELELR